MTISEPAGAGTAEMIAREALERALIEPPIEQVHQFVEDAIPRVAAAITAAESRAMDRCAKIAESYAHIREGSETSVAGDPSPIFADGWDACAKAIEAAISEKRNA